MPFLQIIERTLKHFTLIYRQTSYIIISVPQESMLLSYTGLSGLKPNDKRENEGYEQMSPPHAYFPIPTTAFHIIKQILRAWWKLFGHRLPLPGLSQKQWRITSPKNSLLNSKNPYKRHIRHRSCFNPGHLRRYFSSHFRKAILSQGPFAKRSV